MRRAVLLLGAIAALTACGAADVEVETDTRGKADQVSPKPSPCPTAEDLVQWVKNALQEILGEEQTISRDALSRLFDPTQEYISYMDKASCLREEPPGTYGRCTRLQILKRLEDYVKTQVSRKPAELDLSEPLDLCSSETLREPGSRVNSARISV